MAKNNFQTKLFGFIVVMLTGILFSSQSFASEVNLEACRQSVNKVVHDQLENFDLFQKKPLLKMDDCKKAAKTNPDNPVVLFGIGYAKLNRSFGLNTWREGLDALKLSARKGFSPAAFVLFDKLRVPHSRSNFVNFEGEGDVDKYFQQVMKSGDLHLKTMLILYVSSKAVPEYERQAVEFVTAIENSSDGMALMARAAMYERGYGFERDPKLWIRTMVQAAKAGNKHARRSLAVLRPELWFGPLDNASKIHLGQRFELFAVMTKQLGLYQEADKQINSLAVKSIHIRSHDWQKTQERRQRILMIFSCTLDTKAKKKLQNAALLTPCTM